MKKTVQQKHERYLLQTEWTKPFREYLYRKIPQNRPVSVLEVGCGTGAVLNCIRKEFPGRIGFLAGIDLDREVLGFAGKQAQTIAVQCSGYNMPFISGTFDFVFCHYLLLWVKEAENILKEMYRVTKFEGICAAMAEPDYDGMTAKPKELEGLARRQGTELEKTGANTTIGRDLGNIFRCMGFRKTEDGKYFSGIQNQAFIKQEIEQMMFDCGINTFDYDSSIEYSYNIPTFFAYGIK